MAIASAASPRFSVSGGVTSLPLIGIEPADVDDAGSSSYSIFASRQARRACSRVSAMTQKIGWPWNCTLPSASTGSSCRPVGEMSFSPGTSLAVSTSTTPGAARTADRSIDVIVPCATVDEAEAAMQRAGRLRHVVDIDRLRR